MGPRVFIVIASAVSSISALLHIVCFALFKHWRRRAPSFKHLLLVVTVMDLISALNYQIDTRENPQLCTLQAVIMQFFEIGSWVYTGIIAVELARSLHQSVMLRPDTQKHLCEYQRHLVVYHAIGGGYSLSTTLLLTVGLNIAGHSGAWCWTNNQDWFNFAYASLWISIGVIAASSAYILVLIKRAESVLTMRLSSSSATAKEASKKRRTWALIRRLMLLPLAFALLHVPGSIRRSAKLTGCEWCNSEAMQTIQGICDPSQGTVNFILFGLLDKSMRREMINLWASKKGQVFAFLNSIGCGVCVRMCCYSGQKGSSHFDAWKQENPHPEAAVGRRKSEANGSSKVPPVRENGFSSDESDDDDNLPEEQWVQMTSTAKS